MLKLGPIRAFFKRAYFLARPYGRRKLGLVFLVILIQGLFQVVGVTSIFPFLALASNPADFRNSDLGELAFSCFPDLTNHQLLLVSGVFALAMLLITNLLMLSGEVIRARYSHGFGHWLRMRLLDRIARNQYSFFLLHNSGELLKKASGDVMAYVEGVLSPSLEALARIVAIVFLLATLIWVNPILALSAGSGFITFYALIFHLLKNRRKTASDLLKTANRGAMREAQQLLGGIKPIKIHEAECFFLNRYAEHSRMQASLQKWFPVFQNFPRYIIEPFAFGGIVVLVLILAVRGDPFTSMIPTLGVMAFAAYRLIPNLQILYGATTRVSLMMHSLEEVYEEFENAREPIAGSGLEIPKDWKGKALPWKDSVQIDKVSFRYASAKGSVLNDISLHIGKNQFVAIIGGTGSGKSTLIDILLGLHKPTFGKLLVDGEPLNEERLKEWRMGIGYVPQEIFLLDDSIAANIAFGINLGEIDMNQVRKVAEVAQIRHFIESEMPDGFNSLVGERGVRLSGGQRQRIGLARALYRKPNLLILDEATSALDNVTEAALMRAIESLYGKLTMIVIAHRLSTITQADRIYELKDGTVNRSGTFKELGLSY